MIAVIFEVTLKAEGKARYFDMAQALKGKLSQIEGFISVERFQNLADPDSFLSLSFWQNEAAISQWKAHVEHQVAQEKGKIELFSNYRIRVSNVIRDYGNERNVTNKKEVK
ncbi:antibiotic biosynthesis monooxygenase (plasmid) [Pseudoalteromonas xiamenensis]|uniref:antibiotic biosynthesis monooxygenase family protein n=1 Tax=Pseudoalteromonas xiamenensis TaxID=882626 RepID=UPI0027E3DF8F|nr:antibiotic biosynthesis monooxygenase [Pseudoalteromonas xiamenensis]WMN62060.1 antibiotic biosynthesis monooxygenase [Pseudoalteromonas xiamenensis]